MREDYIAKNERRGRKCVITAQETGQTVACRKACIIEDFILEDKKNVLALRRMEVSVSFHINKVRSPDQRFSPKYKFWSQLLSFVSKKYFYSVQTSNIGKKNC